MEQVNKPVFEKYAIFQTGGKQYQAIPGKTVAIEKLEGNAGDAVDFTEVLFRKDGDEKFEFGRLLDGKIGRLGTLQNLVDVEGGAPKEIASTYVIGHQATAVSDLNRIGVNRGQFVAGSEFAHSCAIDNE